MSQEFPYRKNTRLKHFDYTQAGAYFVTICTQGRQCLFGHVVDGKMILNDAGKMVVSVWNDLTNHIMEIELDEFVVMPNHIHGVIVINPHPVGTGSKPVLISDAFWAGLEPAPTGGKRHGLSEIIRQLKTFSARRINQINNTSGLSVWQRSFHDHIIRNDNEYERICEYIKLNPQNWSDDAENPSVK